jgi:glucosyl-3-phosphoglycerate synthase
VSAPLACVVIPARDEQERIAGCLEALAAQRLSGGFEIVLVLDGCTDATAAVARETAERAGLVLHAIPGPGRGTGPARRAGMDLAARRLLAAGRPDGLIASTDADTRVAPDWLARQLDHVAGGALAIGGLIELDAGELAQLGPEVAVRRAADAQRRLAAVRVLDPAAEHHHFAGASLGITAAAYLAVGGIEPLVALEDEAFAHRLRERRVAIVRPADVRVRTSARTAGRAARGLSADLALAHWAQHRRYEGAAYDLATLRELKGDTTVAAVLPAREVAGTIATVLRRAVLPLRAAGIVDEILVVDAGSADGTAAAARAEGVRVAQQDALLSRFGPALGKGDAMWRALHATTADVVAFVDADTVDPSPGLLAGLLGPLLGDPGVALVKGAFDRPLRTSAGDLAHEGGRVTELMARPLLNLHFPLLAGFAQPLAGEVAARRELLERLAFPAGYGVEIAMLIDALALEGLDALAEVRLGSRQNRHQPLRALGEMAYAVLAAVEHRIGPRSAARGHFVRPWEQHASTTVPVTERPPLRGARSLFPIQAQG